MAQTSANVLAVFKEMYEQGVKNDYNRSTPALAVLTRDGEDFATAAREHFFAIKTRRGQTARTYGSEDPYEFATCSAPPDYERVCLTYVKHYIPFEISNELLYEGTDEGAMFNVLTDGLDDLAEQHASQMERQFLTGDGRDVLFVLTGTETGPDADGNFTYGVQWYGGYQGEALGQILENLTLCGMSIHVATECGVAPVDTNAALIVGVDPTFGAETITVSTPTAGGIGGGGAVADEMIVYRSREDTNGVQGCTDGMFGLPALVDDFSLVEPFQCLSADDCQVFTAKVLDNGGVQRDLTEELLSKAVAIAMARSPLNRGQAHSWQKYVFFTHPFTARKFANGMTALRQLTAPSLWGRKGIKPAFGVEMEALTFDGIPFMESQLAMMNDAFLTDVSNLILLHNGPAEGQFLADPRGNTIERINCSPRFQYVWWAFVQFAVRSRKGMVRVSDLQAWDVDAP